MATVGDAGSIFGLGAQDNKNAKNNMAIILKDVLFIPKFEKYSVGKFTPKFYSNPKTTPKCICDVFRLILKLSGCP